MKTCVVCIKLLIKDFCQKYTLNVTRDTAQSMKTLENEIVVLQDLITSLSLSLSIQYKPDYKPGGRQIFCLSLLV